MALAPSTVAALVGAGVIQAQGGGSPVVQTLRAISPTNRMNTKLNTFGAALTNLAIQKPFYIGSGDVSEIVLSVSNFALGGTDIQLPANAITYGPFYVIEDSTGTSVQVTWGGQTTVTVPAGGADIQCDKILPSAFGKSKFTRADKYYAKGVGIAPGGATRVQEAPTFTQGGGGTGAYAVAYDPTVTTITNMSTKGAFTSTGTAPTNTQPFSIVVLGRFVSGDPATFGGIGDSIVEYVGDTAATTSKGFFSRSLWDTLDVATGCRGGINMGLAGGVVGLWLSANYSKLKPYLQYCSVWLAEYGTNTFTTASTGNVTTQVNNEKALAAAIRTDGAVNGRTLRLWRTKLLPRTAGANVQADGSDQTQYTNAWEVGGDVDLYNSALEAMVGTTYDAYVKFDTQVRINANDNSSVAYHRWIANSVDTASNPNLHPNSTTAELMASAVLRPMMQAA